MKITRRDAVAMGIGAAAVTVLPLQAFAAMDDLVNEFTGGADVGSGDFVLDAPEIAENGNTVPIEVSAPGAQEIVVFATGNPSPPVATFEFGPAAGDQSASTRVRLAKTQDLLAIARMGDGSYIQTTATVKVTIGGCGG